MVASEFPREKILPIAKKLPTGPRILGKLEQLLADPTSGLDDICQLLKKDVGLTSRIIRISNSPAFGATTPHASLEEAVGFVGYSEIYRLVGFAAGAQMVEKDLQFYGYTRTALWQNTLVTALAMEKLAKSIGYDTRAAYTTGLMRSIGKTILDHLAIGTLSPHDTFLQRGDGRLRVWEQGAFGCDNAAVTAWLLEEWNFPQGICEAIRNHYAPEESLQAGKLPCLLNFAGRIANDLGHGLNGETMYWEPHPAKFARSGLTEETIKTCTEETQTAFEIVRLAFS